MRAFAVRVVCAWMLALGAVAGLLAQGGDAQKPDLKDPSTLTEDCPAKYSVKFETSQGDFVIEVDRSWAPRGAVRFYNLVKNGFYTDARIFRVLEFMAQFGIPGDPAVAQAWRGARIIDDRRTQTNERGYVSYAAGGPNTRTTQIFVNLKDNTMLDQANFVPFGRVTSGLNVLEKVYKGYGDGPPNGKGPEQNKIYAEGNAYLAKEFPKLDYIKSATLIEKK